MSFSEVIACNYMCVRLQHSIITNNSMGIIRQFKRHLHYVCFLYASARSLVQSSNFPMQRSNILKQNRVPDCLLSLHYFNVSISSYSSFLCLNVLTWVTATIWSCYNMWMKNEHIWTPSNRYPFYDAYIEYTFNISKAS